MEGLDRTRAGLWGPRQNIGKQRGAWERGKELRVAGSRRQKREREASALSVDPLLPPTA